MLKTFKTKSGKLSDINIFHFLGICDVQFLWQILSGLKSNTLEYCSAKDVKKHLLCDKSTLFLEKTCFRQHFKIVCYFVTKWHTCSQNNLLTSTLQWHGQVELNKQTTHTGDNMKLHRITSVGIHTENTVQHYAKTKRPHKRTLDNEKNTSVIQWNQLLHRNSLLVVTTEGIQRSMILTERLTTYHNKVNICSMLGPG